MIRLLLALALILPAAAFAAPKKNDKFKKKKESRMKVVACKKACIPAHDAKVVACKTVNTKDPNCVADADKERADCEEACTKPAPKAAEKKD